MTDQAQKRPKRPRDANQLARAIVAEATGETAMTHTQEKDQAAVSLGRRGGLKGGAARAERLTAIERKEIAQRAAQARWKKK